ncbi:MAG TPA: HAD family hydrolase [Blastocatellia bacterium]|nr:HAD family hydrolase [Blastocatellia bacterium]
MIRVASMLFDLDGTLIDSGADLASSINLMLADLGRSGLSEATVGGFVGDGVRVLVYRSLTATHPDHQPPDESTHEKGISLMHSHYADEMFKTTHLYPGVAETLAGLTGKRKAVVTSKEVRFTRMILERFGISKYFDAIIGGDTTPARKPDPGPVLEAVRQLGGSVREAVMIGDSENDVVAGKRAGTYTCAVSYGFRSAEQLRETEPDVLLERIEQLNEFFL